LQPVTICLTSIASRLQGLPVVVRSLLAQTYDRTRIRVYLSHDAYLIDAGVKRLPPELEELVHDTGPDKLKISFTENTGPYRKLLPELRANADPERLIVTVDDDVIYPADVVETLVAAEWVFGCPVAFRGRRMTLGGGHIEPYRRWAKERLSGVSPLNVPTGKDGVIYRPRYLANFVLDQRAALEVAPTADDLWFKWATVLAGYPSAILNDSLKDSFAEIGADVDSAGSSLYSTFNEKGKNDRAVEALEGFARERLHQSVFGALSRSMAAAAAPKR
jgi:hypothetical protein